MNRTPQSPIPPFELERYFARWEFNAPYLLCTSDIQGYPMRDLLELAAPADREQWDTLTLGYTESTGLPALRAEIAALYQSVSAQEVLCFSGAEEAIYIAARVLLRPGDHAVVLTPCYQSLYQVAEACGAEVTRLPLRLEKDPSRPAWRLDPADLRAALRPNTRLVVINAPHNPTGWLPSQAEWEELVGIVREAGCYFFSDEVYRWLEFDPADRLPAAVDRYEKALSLGVMSKPFALAGLRIGWAACRDADLLRAMAAYKDYTTICNSAPSEILALIALRARERVLDRSMTLLRKNLDTTRAFMQRRADRFEWIAPRAGTIAFPAWKGPQSVEEFCAALVESQGVLLLPGSVYGQPGRHFRYGLGRTNLPDALERVDRFLDV